MTLFLLWGTGGLFAQHDHELSLYGGGGIASKRDTEPLVPNTNEENRRQNRRVQLVIQ